MLYIYVPTHIRIGCLSTVGLSANLVKAHTETIDPIITDHNKHHVNLGSKTIERKTSFQTGLQANDKARELYS